MSADQLILYCIAIFSVSIIPGPSMALAFAEGARGGVNRVVPLALGNVTASLGQALIAFFAFRSVVSLEPRVLLTVQAVGALYIAYIGYIFIRHGSSFRLDTAGPEKQLSKATEGFQTGFLIAFFNPKAILFFVALFPQFVNSEIVASVGALSSVFLPIGLIALICFLAYGFLGQLSLQVFDESKVFNWIVPGLGGFLLLTATLGLLDAINQIF
ncbi:leucine export protein LeuE [Pseudovibrio sp. W64]|uniref:LysE family translocator n=1 Tax=Pseudovibrio sp. W64 TaxID=1735583 RepID=UPI0007AE5CF3|nr:LysE family translocator [Pseudovibrio sp. W64]KZK87732.1 leucine export protein LeuE [Pseudovibrio sp. W64]